MRTLSALPITPEHTLSRPAATRAAPAKHPQLQTRLITTREQLEALAPQWQALEAETESAVLFQSCGWSRAVFDFEAARGNTGFEPVIMTIMDGVRLVAVLPLERIRTRARTVLAPLGHAFSQYSDVLLAADANPLEAVPRLLRAAVAAAPCDVISFLKVRSDSLLARGLPAGHIVTGATQGAPYVALGGFADFASYFTTIKTKTRKNLRNTRNRLERDGTLTHHVADSAEDTLSIINRTLNGRAERLKDQGLTSRAFSDSAFADFCQSLAGRADLPVLAMSLQHNQAPIAEQWGFIHNRRYYAFIASRDFANAEESPGKLHLGEVIQTCAERGLQGADLMVPAMPYKLTWATEVVTVNDYALPMTPRGQLVLTLWDRTLRPWAKALVLAMPTGPRALLLRLAGRNL